MPAQHYKSFIVGLVCFIGLISFIGMAYGADPMLSQIQSLMQEMETLKQDLQKEDETKTALDKEKVALIQTGELIKEAEENYKKDWAQWEKDSNNWHADVDRHNAYKCKSDDSACIDAYNEEARKDNATIKVQLKERGLTLIERGKVIKERREGLNPAVNEWARKVKENNARLNELYAKYQFKIMMIRGLTVKPAGRQLIQNSGASQECANIPGIDKLEKRLDGAAEQAHRCLQKIWDGAK
jgi:uncharacterized protein (DUF3084 family)